MRGDRMEGTICDALVAITKAIDERDPERVAHGCLGGTHGYGAHWDSPVFEMRPFYWGDCDCGYDERETAFAAAHKHSDDCYQSALTRAMEEYDRDSGYKEIERAAFGDEGLTLFTGMDVEQEELMPGVTGITMTPRKDDTMEAWRTASDARRGFEDGVYTRLCAQYGLKRLGCAVHCTCGLDRAWEVWAKDNGHRDTCALELPNFRHKASGFEVRWYKYIGRSMEYIKRPAKLTELHRIFAECSESLSTVHTEKP